MDMTREDGEYFKSIRGDMHHISERTRIIFLLERGYRVASCLGKINYRSVQNFPYIITASCTRIIYRISTSFRKSQIPISATFRDKYGQPYAGIYVGEEGALEETGNKCETLILPDEKTRRISQQFSGNRYLLY